MDNYEPLENKKQDYRKNVNTMGKKEFTLLKMQEYGFWPEDLPTPYEKQSNETKEDYNKRKSLLEEYQKMADKITNLYKEKNEIDKKLSELKKQYDETWDYEKIRLDVAKHIMKESIERRKARKEQKELEKKQRSEAWNKKKADNIVFIGKNYSSLLNDIKNDDNKLILNKMPIIKGDKDLAKLLGIEYSELRFLAYHRDVVTVDNYYQYTIPKKSGGNRNIAAPKSVLKSIQRKILEEILEKVPISNYAYGFLKGKSVISGAKTHINSTELLINMDLENFFPTITFERVRGMFKSFGYSGYISSILAMICTYCERIPIEVKGEIKYVKISDRILPQGSPSSPMITNIICTKLDKRLSGLASKFNFVYTRYADDMSFSLMKDEKEVNIEKFIGLISKIVTEEGFKINKKKTRFLRKNNRQCITGIVINNEQIGVPKKWVKILRAKIYNANKLKNIDTIPFETIHEISGMISWLKSVNSQKYSTIINDASNLLYK